MNWRSALLSGLESNRLWPSLGFIFLVPMLLELGLENCSIKRDRLASDEPNELLISPT